MEPLGSLNRRVRCSNLGFRVAVQRWYGGEDNNEGLCGLVLWCPGYAMRGLEKEITLTFQRYVILDAKRQQTGSLKVKIDLCQENHKLSAMARF